MGHRRDPATPDTHERPHQRVYRDPFKLAHGPAPYTCYFCQELMESLEVVHHLDEDPWNNVLDNLVSAHTVCHNRHHHVGITMSAESNEARRAWSLEFSAAHSKEERSKIHGLPGELNPFYGKTHTEETRKVISEKAKTRPKNLCSLCGLYSTVSGFSSHANSKLCRAQQGRNSRDGKS